MPAADPRLDVAREHLQQLFATTSLSQLGAAVLVVLGVILGREEGNVSDHLLTIWSMAALTGILYRHHLAHQYKQKQDELSFHDLDSWQRRAMFALGISGTVWGLYAWLPPPGGGRDFLPVVALLAVTVTGASLVLVTAQRRYYLSFGIPIFLLLLLRFLLVSPRAYLLAMALTVCYVILERAADRARRILEDLVRRRDYNARLNRALQRQGDLLSQERDRLHRLLESVPMPLAHCDHTLTLRHHNRHFHEAFVGRPGRSLMGKAIPELLGQRRFQPIASHWESALAGTPCSFEIELPVRTAEGLRRRTYRVTLTPDASEDHEDRRGVYVHCVDVTSYKSTVERLSAIALHDPLTGLYNRRGFEAILTQTLERHPERLHSIIYLDLDRLKEINDLFGHDAGDAALRTFAQRLVASVRRDDHCARLGGDEFAILLENCPLDCAERVASTIERAITAPVLHGNNVIPLTASIGGVSFIPRQRSIDEALQAADRCMYESKRGRRIVLRLLP